MIQRNHPDPAYYDGARDALYEYQNCLNDAASNGWRQSYPKALAELNALAAEAAANAAIVKSSNELEKI